MTSERPHELGVRGEDVAASYLRGKGLRILQRRFRRRGGEIDLICSVNSAGSDRIDEVVFVEVKSRSSLSFGPPELAVSGKKRARMRRVAETFLAEHGLTETRSRFDVVTIIWNGPETSSVKHYVDAFGILELMDVVKWNDDGLL